MDVNAEIARLYATNGIANGGELSWDDIGARFGISGNAARKRNKRYKESGGQKAGRWEQQSKNRARGEATFDFPANIDDLIEKLDVDTEIWTVERWGYSAQENNWEGYAKVGTAKTETKTGWIKEERLETIPLHGESCKIWAIFVRIEPLQIFPVIHPVECKVTYRMPRAPKKGDVARMLVVCDPHIGYRKQSNDALLIPFHDRAVLDLALQIAEYANVDVIEFLGDTLDMNEWSDKFTKEPEFQQTTQPAIDETHWWLRQFREACPEARIIKHEGNHDERLPRALKNHLPAACGLRRADASNQIAALSMPNLLALDALAIEWKGNYPQDLEWINKRLAAFHGDITRSTPGGTARAVVDKIRAFVVFGHSHTQEIVTLNWVTTDGAIIGTGFCPGCACHTDGRVPGDNGRSNWQKGLGLIEYVVGGNRVTPIPLTIEDSALIYDGKLFKARNRLADLKRDIPQYIWGK